MVKRMMGVLAALAAAVVMALAIQAPASANTNNNGVCESTEFCAWYWSDFTGAMLDNEGNINPWPQPIQDDDMSWWNRGTPCGGCDHVRLWDTDPAGADVRTLCIHQGAIGNAYENSAALNAANRTDRHTWGGECGSNEPQLS